ncbi:hypothetical protein HYV49_03630 [Candidatus Pacearchaeota archaeon]|nr:hypothetical protein [Candidatus Pacearchaeota archaeon]
MGWFKKKKEEEDIIPELPGLLEGDELLSQDDQIPEDQEQIEEQAGSEMYETEEPIPEPVLQELESESEQREEPEPRYEPAERIVERYKEEPQRQVPETQFVRLDKFESAYASIANIKKKIEEMNSFLRDIRQLNAKEDAELSAWEKEINEIKIKIENIDKALFENLE